MQVLDIFSAGDLLDRYIINELKMSNLGPLPNLKLENEKIDAFFNNSFDVQKEIKDLCEQLKCVLKKQWDALDVSMNEENDIELRKEKAIEAQLINFERVYWKNKINKLCGSQVEVKKYASRRM